MTKKLIMEQKIFKIHKLNEGLRMRQRSIARNLRMPSYHKESRQFSLGKFEKTNMEEICSVGQVFSFKELISKPQSFFDDKIFEILYDTMG